MTATDSGTRLQAALEEVTTLLERHRVLETWTRNQAVGRQREIVESLVHRQNVGELHHGCARCTRRTSRTSWRPCPERTARSSGSRFPSRGRAACFRSWGGPCAKT